ncbi:SDR family NAD(P)-dependent oxidoreductase [Stenotrophobium rhamnosiphilum]|uniref:SDR family NAD(P)-dependent oxidoreductase n=1 Tax=Stenotrophobium rhamnosiphilum TaxID=2029166 RepID=UPI0019D02B13|nr:SDR family oxidoreductase [Stenotrophobium rhamnosiphilum]
MTNASHQSKPVVVVTGASQGIGAAIAERFASRVSGVQLALVATNAERLSSVAQKCRAIGATAEIFPTDLNDNAQVECLAAEVHKTFGHVDVLINNAGRWRGGAAHEMSVSDFAQVLQDNLINMFAVTRAFLPPMLERGSGDVFLMSSTSGLVGLANNAAYCAAKHGVAGFSKALRAEVAGRGIRVCCVYPGGTESPSWEGSGVDVKTLMSAEDVADVFVDAYQRSRRTVLEDIILRPLAAL